MATVNRGAQYHKERLAGALRDEIAALLAGGLVDPRIGLVTLTNLIMGAGNHSMHAYVTIEGSEREVKKSLVALNDAAGFIRHELKVNLVLRKVPELVFVLDNSEKVTTRINELLKRAEKQAKTK